VQIGDNAQLYSRILRIREDRGRRGTGGRQHQNTVPEKRSTPQLNRMAGF
jgi:hypothetical protein